MNLRSGCAALLTFILASGCADGDATLHVNLRTDYAPSAEWDEARIFLVKPDGEEVHIHTATAVDYIAGARVRSFEGLAEGNYEVRAELITPERQILGSRRQAFTLTQETFATVLISRSCGGVICPMSNPEATECSGGRCVSPECSETNQAACEEGCSANSECVAPAPCATGVCTAEGACLFMTIAGACGDSEYCDSEVGCVTASRSDAGVRDSSTPDVPGVDGGPGDAGPPDDVGFDAGAPSCDMPCDTGNVCELGIFDCSTGIPVCVSAGAGNMGVSCREASGSCDAEELCDGTNIDCPEDLRIPAGTECRADAGDCDVAEVCDGMSTACPLDAFEDIGTPCSGGSCDETNTCSDTCSAGASCTPSNICRSGQIDCTGGTPSCVAMGNVADGAECATTEFGSYGACGGFGGTCDETGTESRSVTMNTCQSGTCAAQVSSESRACMRGTEGGSCGSLSTGAWSSCSGFSGTCDETGTRTRSVTTPICASGACDNSMSTETDSCSRTTNGTSCGSVTTGAWGACGGFADTCDTTGTQSRSVMTPSCSGGGCSTVTSSESRSCTRSTNGTSCGSAATGAWGSCGGFSNSCDTTGTQSRSIMTPSCSSGSCETVTTSESRSCSRTTNGASCGSVTNGAWGSCGGFSSTCDTTGTQSRSVMTPTCSGGSCGTATSSESRSCSRTTNGVSCGGVTFGGWGSCGGFSNTCDTTGTQSRSVMTPTCSSGSCGTVTSSESRSCSRTTNGVSCGGVTTSAWGSCGGFSNTCDTTGTQSRSVFTPTCGSGSCSTVTSSESRSCTRSTNGTSCGSVSYGSWGACGTFISTCDTTGTRSRSVFTPTCSSSSCGTVTTSQSESCTRNTNGNYCEDFPNCQRGSCSAGSCSLTGSPCLSPRRCCEPGICINASNECP